MLAYPKLDSETRENYALANDTPPAHQLLRPRCTGGIISTNATVGFGPGFWYILYGMSKGLWV